MGFRVALCLVLILILVVTFMRRFTVSSSDLVWFVLWLFYLSCLLCALFLVLVVELGFDFSGLVVG